MTLKLYCAAQHREIHCIQRSAIRVCNLQLLQRHPKFASISLLHWRPLRVSPGEITPVCQGAQLRFETHGSFEQEEGSFCLLPQSFAGLLIQSKAVLESVCHGRETETETGFPSRCSRFRKIRRVFRNRPERLRPDRRRALLQLIQNACTENREHFGVGREGWILVGFVEGCDGTLFFQRCSPRLKNRHFVYRNGVCVACAHENERAPGVVESLRWRRISGVRTAVGRASPILPVSFACEGRSEGVTCGRFLAEALRAAWCNSCAKSAPVIPAVPHA